MVTINKPLPMGRNPASRGGIKPAAGWRLIYRSFWRPQRPKMIGSVGACACPHTLLLLCTTNSLDPPPPSYFDKMGQIRKNKKRMRFKKDLLHFLIRVAGKQKDKEQSNKTREGEHEQLSSEDDAPGRLYEHLFLCFLVY